MSAKHLRPWRPRFAHASRSRGRRCLSLNVEVLRRDFAEVTGRPFDHFFCPVTWQDAPGPLSRGHIVNAACRGGTPHWVAQRSDVDCFFGSHFESAFVLRDAHAQAGVMDVIADRELSRELRPEISVGGRVVRHYLPAGPVPDEHTELMVERDRGRPFRLALRMPPDRLAVAGGFSWEARTCRDLHTPAVVSLIKAAHLTMFAMLGYRYALSPGAELVGRQILGGFMDATARRSRAGILEAAAWWFRPYATMVRRLRPGSDGLAGTLDDGRLLFSVTDDGEPWALIPLIRIKDVLRAVVLPTLVSTTATEQFHEFLRGQGPPLKVCQGSGLAGRAWFSFCHNLN